MYKHKDLGADLKSVIGKWGNSPGVRIPAGVMQDAGFSIKQPIEIKAVDGKIVIEKNHSLSIEQLVAGINQDNLHAESDFGLPVGKEVL
jgi:antitoxin MazE